MPCRNCLLVMFCPVREILCILRTLCRLRQPATHGPKKGVWNFQALKAQHLLGLESSRHLFLGETEIGLAQSD